jgi:hypothetical protein
MHSEINLSHHGFTVVCTPEWPLINYATNDLTTDNEPGAPPPEDTSDDKTIDPQQPDLTCTPDLTIMKTHRHVVLYQVRCPDSRISLLT